MTFALTLVLLATGLVAGLVYLLLRRRAEALIIGAIAGCALAAWFFNPVCRPISQAEAAAFDPPLVERQDRGLIGQEVFQERDGQWFHCKVWIARAMFF